MAPTAKTAQKKKDEKTDTKQAKDAKKKEDEPEMVNYLLFLMFTEVYVVLAVCKCRLQRPRNGPMFCFVATVFSLYFCTKLLVHLYCNLSPFIE